MVTSPPRVPDTDSKKTSSLYTGNTSTTVSGEGHVGRSMPLPTFHPVDFRNSTLNEEEDRTVTSISLNKFTDAIKYKGLSTLHVSSENLGTGRDPVPS